MHRIVLLISFLVGLTLTRPGFAVPVPLQYTLILDFHTGPLSGQSFIGTIETEAGAGLKTPANGGLLDFSITVDNRNFTMQSDGGYPNFPSVEIGSDGTSIPFMDFLGTVDNEILEIDVLGATYGVLRQSNANIKLQLISGQTPATVPDSGPNLLLFALGFFGLVSAHRVARPGLK
ncbi:MAG TPA: hypothetical protein PLX89_02850 [Verrucomicrobiota bacterium]|nr:hypothetical protein [Verrucomicrobiales bacterium]HRI11919.1 hypothetical protein [Verrucomicrobiota bacterium]